MVKGCVNGNLDETKYAAPVQVIGWYIAAGSAVCLLFMLFDIVSDVRRRERWIPCRIFPLNSISLSLLAIISKVPVDLTTPMPGVHDQLSKLTATTMICICICFMAPSVASGSHSEHIANLASLTIFVITVAVNVCIQLYTGVIQLYFAEHIIIICCMLFLTFLLWFCASEVRTDGEYLLNMAKLQIMEGDGGLKSLFQRMTVSYYNGFRLNPQLQLCKSLNYSTMAVFSIVSSGIVIQASVKSLVLKQFTFCGGNGSSDYGVSVWIVVVLQILTTVVGCFVTNFRWYSFFFHFSFENAFPLKSYSEESVTHMVRAHPALGAHRCHVFWMHLQDYAWYVVLLARALTIIPTLVASKVYRASPWYGSNNNEPEEVITGCADIHRRSDDPWKMDVWAWKKVVDHKERCEKASERRPLQYMIEFVSRPLSAPVPALHSYYSVSSLSMVLLIQMATFCFPPQVTKPLQQCFHETYEIICFIEDKMGNPNIYRKRRNNFTKYLLIGDGLHVYRPQVISSCPELSSPSLTQSARVRIMLDCLYLSIGSPADIRLTFNSFLTQIYSYDDDEIILPQEKDANKVLGKIKSLFVDLLYAYLAKLPLAIAKEMIESSPENFGNRSKRILKMVINIKAIEQHVPWEFGDLHFSRIFDVVDEEDPGEITTTELTSDQPGIP